MLSLLIQILSYLAWTLSMVVLVLFILSLAINFNIVSMSNQYVSALYDSLNKILDPFLRPIRKIMPDTGMLDFSPMVLLVGLNVLIMVLNHAGSQVYTAGM
jgi:YggT family protein